MSMLRLVPPEGQPPKPPRPKYRRSEPHLSKEEMDRVKVVLHHLRHRWGSWDRVAEIMGNVNPATLCKVAGPGKVVSPGWALAAAKVANTTVEAILSGSLVLVNDCPHCGK
jgi:hypothetical protein